MKKYLSLLLLGLAVISAMGCYDKIRNVDPNDPNLYNPQNPPGSSGSVKWDWSGTAPLSGIIGGETINIDLANTEIEKYEVANTNKYTFSINSTLFGVYPRYAYQIDIKKDLSPGVYNIGMLPPNRDFNLFYQKNVSLNDGKMYNSISSTLKIVTNDNDIIEGYFLGKLMDYSTSATIDIQNGYFKFEKAGIVIRN